MKIKMLIPLLLSVTALSACAEIPPVREPVPIEQQSIVTPSGDGWTAAELMSATYFEGIELCYPLTLRDFGSGYTLDYSWQDDDGTRTHYLVDDFFSLEALAYINFEHNDEMISADEEIKAMAVYHDNISVNGLKIAAAEADVEGILGTPDVIDDLNEFTKRYIYCDKETGKAFLYIFVGTEGKKVTGFGFILK
ncbi:MAG: hypothetical protein MSJ26_00420 [Oscillospiraceae bacterium]|nr:hypothetical protein [Oscillospiraceae bacterium]